MSHKLGICIPYRNRKEHIENLIPHLSKYLNEKGINHSFYVGHQIDEKLFNRCINKVKHYESLSE
jgi:xylosylprotein 4-beta-galactosyltransferase